MIIFPAIDIKGGKCVRLFQGDFNKVTLLIFLGIVKELNLILYRVKLMAKYFL